MRPLIAAGAILPFLPALGAPFLDWDDALNLAGNPYWRGFTTPNIRWMLTTLYGGPYQPLSWLSYAFDFTVWGPNPIAMRATNLALHAGCAVLLFSIVETLIKIASPGSAARERTLAAAFAALCWATHPLRVESVVWLTERRDVLSGFFYLLAIFLYVRRRGGSLAPLLAFYCAVLSKASALTLPLTLLLLDAWPLGRLQRDKRGALLEKAPYFVVSLAVGLTGLAGQRTYGTLQGFDKVGAAERLALALHSFWWYAAKTVWPSSLSPYHRVPSGFGLGSPLVWGATLGVLFLSAAVWAVCRRAPAVSVAALHYAFALAPLAGLARFGHHLVAERYSYLPGLSLATLAGAGLMIARRRAAWRVPASAAAAAMLLAYSAMSARGAAYWSGNEALWRRVLAVDPNSNLARINLASFLRREGRVGDALELERAAVAQDPNLCEQLNNLGADAVKKNNFAEGEKLFRAAIAAKPDLATAHYNLAGVLGRRGRHVEALAELEEAARLDTENSDIFNNLGLAFLMAGKAGRAEIALRRAAALYPNSPVAHYNWGNALTALGRPQDALKAYDAAARLDPLFTQAWINGGNASARMGRLREAAARYEQALKLAPNDASARQNLEQVRRALKR